MKMPRIGQTNPSRLSRVAGNIARGAAQGAGSTRLFGADLYCRKELYGADLYNRKPPFGSEFYCNINSELIYQ